MLKKILIVLTIIIMLGIVSIIESTYTREVVVISNKNNIVTCEDANGYVWQYRGQANVGDNITLIMHDNHTGTITDDIIKGVK